MFIIYIYIIYIPFIMCRFITAHSSLKKLRKLSAQGFENQYLIKTRLKGSIFNRISETGWRKPTSQPFLFIVQSTYVHMVNCMYVPCTKYQISGCSWFYIPCTKYQISGCSWFYIPYVTKYQISGCSKFGITVHP